MNNKFKYAIHNKGVQGHTADRPLSSWVILVSLILFAFVAGFALVSWLLARPVQGASEWDACQLSSVVCKGEVAPDIKTVKYITAYQTYYGHESCINKGCITASGNVAREGTVACPRNIKLGTTVWVDNNPLVCTDRYATWVDNIRDYPTFDIWTENSEAWSLAQGIKKVTVGVIE